MFFQLLCNMQMKLLFCLLETVETRKCNNRVGIKDFFPAKWNSGFFVTRLFETFIDI